MLKRLIIAIFVIITSSFVVWQWVFADIPVQFNIIGINGDLLKNTQARLTAEAKSYNNLLSDNNLSALQQEIPKQVQQAVAPYGYFNPRINTRLIKLAPHKWQLTVKVQPGKQVQIQHINLHIQGEGLNNAALKEFLLNFPLKKHQAFNSPDYEKSKTDWLQVANDQGFIRAKFIRSEVLINKNTHQATIFLWLETGHRYYFGKFAFNKTPYAQNFLHAFIPFNNKEHFSSIKLIDLQQQMTDSYYFDHVNMVPDFNHIEDYQVPVLVTVTPPKARRYNIGLGFGTFTGPRLSAGLNLRRLNDHGQHFDAQMRISKVMSGLAAKYYFAGKNPLRDRWMLGANYQRFLPMNGQSKAATLTGGYLTTWHSIKINATINYLLERFSINNSPETMSRLLYPSLNMSYVKADDMINPANGHSLNLTVLGAYKNLASSTSFAQADLKAKWIVTPLSFAQFVVRGELGYTIVHDVSLLPLTMQFFAGGLNSIRGFQESSIGPGRYIKIASAEYRNKITTNLALAAFYDLGIADNHFNAPINKSIGLGMVYASPFGPIRLYIAQAISKPSRPHSLEFSIGPEF